MKKKTSEMYREAKMSNRSRNRAQKMESRVFVFVRKRRVAKSSLLSGNLRSFSKNTHISGHFLPSSYIQTTLRTPVKWLSIFTLVAWCTDIHKHCFVFFTTYCFLYKRDFVFHGTNRIVLFMLSTLLTFIQNLCLPKFESIGVGTDNKQILKFFSPS